MRRHFWRHVKASSGPASSVTTSGKRSSVSCHNLKGERRDRRRGETQPELTEQKREKMTSFSNKFGAYTMTQLNEILEDDEKLTKMVHEMDEVCLPAALCGPSLASCWLLFPVRLLSLDPLLCSAPPNRPTVHGRKSLPRWTFRIWRRVPNVPNTG